MAASASRLFLFVCFQTWMSRAFAIIPGVAPHDYLKDEPIPVKVNKLTSVLTHVPYEFYHFPFCQPVEGPKNEKENLGEYLLGETIQSSPYKVSMFEEQLCVVLCRKLYSAEEVAKFADLIRERYHHNWIIDNLPVASLNSDDRLDYSKGFLVGGIFPEEAKPEQKPGYYLNNHVTITILYNRTLPNDETARIVGVHAYPQTIKHSYDGSWSDNGQPPVLKSCGNGLQEPLYLIQPGEQSSKSPVEVVWTYDVEFKPSDTAWSARWDIYLSMPASSNQVHWFSIVNSMLIVFFLAGMVGMIMMRTLKRDISRYNRVPTEEERAEEREESGWKLVHADVFRPPVRRPMLFCVFIGTGYQIFAMTMVTLFFACIGLLSPANRGAIMIALLLCYVLMGSAAGYQAAQTYKMFKGKQWQKCTIYTAFLYPGTVFGIFFFLNLLVWAEGSAAAVPFGSMFAVLVLWFGISVPLVFLGAWLGFKQPPITFPVATSNIPRPIPPQPWYMNNTSMAFVGGILPFGAVFVELFYILSSLWLDQYYSLFGFLFLVVLILLITCAEITVVLIYFQLCSEDYHWWWRSFITSGSTGILVFFYSGYYFMARLFVDGRTAAFLFFGYMFIISYGLFLLTGTVGYKTCLWFTRKIYASIKVD